MNWMEFVASLVGSIAWPVAVITVVLVFRRNIVDRLPDLSKLKVGSLEAEFREALQEVVAAVPAVVVAQHENLEAPPVDVPDAELTYEPAPADSPPKHSVQQESAPFAVPRPVDSIALRANPTGVVMEAWKALESSLYTLVAMSVPEQALRGRTWGTETLLEMLKSRGLLDEIELDALHRMLIMRNLAAHSPESVPPDDARSFAKLAYTLATLYERRAAP